MFSALYIYGHLFTATLSLVMAASFFSLAGRIPQYRADRWQALVFALMCGSSVAEMALALEPAIRWGRLYYVLIGCLFLSIAHSNHRDVLFAGLLRDGERRVYRRALAVYTLAGLVLVTLVGAGAADRGLRLEAAGAVRMSVVVFPWPAAVIAFLYTTSLLPMVGVLYVREARRHGLRRDVVVIGGTILLSPLIVAREALICTGALHGLPFGGYVAGLLGLNGVFTLLERLRVLVGRGAAATVLGGYRLGARLGSGGMAEVFAAEKRGQGELAGVVQRVALKRMRRDLVGDPTFLRMFLDEAKLAARLHHPHIVTLHDVGLDAGAVYLAMELVEGITLWELLRQHAGVGLPPRLVVELGVQMSDALAYAHQLTDGDRPLGLVHRDVSPQNILLARNGLAKLTDFGIARAEGRSTQTDTGVLKGKIGYMAPEQVRGEPFDHRVDLWALGVVLCEAATGTRLYDGLSEPQIIGLAWQRKAPPLDALDGAPPELARVIRGLLEPDRERRPADAAALHRLLLPLRDEARARAALGALVVAAAAAAPPDSQDPPDPDDLHTQAARPLRQLG